MHRNQWTTWAGLRSAGLIVLFFVSLIGAYGMGFFFAGLTMVYKRTSALTGLTFSLMIFLTGAFVGLEKLGWMFTVSRFLFPLTWGISLMRQTVTGDVSLASLWDSGELVSLCLHSVIYLAMGLAVFNWGYRAARRNGTLAHY